MDEFIDEMEGYKATDENMKCRGHQFELGKWYEIEGDIELCKNGFHFCDHPSGVWSYYDAKDTRVFKIKARQVLKTKKSPGADNKRVCRQICLVEEVSISGDRNTGDGNTGDVNTGYHNTGHRNTGNGNTGNRNTGDVNTGYHNTGHRNTGDRNTGDVNTGYHNTGHRNTGDGNTGDVNTGYHNTGHRNTGDGNTGDVNTGYHNTGHRNTGDGNTGDGNACNNSAGFFCSEEPSVICFDVNSGITRSEFRNQFGRLANELSLVITEPEPIDFKRFETLPGITPEKLETLHEKHITERQT